MSAPKVVIVGGGAVGLSIAWRCKARGLAVALVDESPGRSASWAAAGMLAPVTEVHYGEEALLHLNLEAAARYARWVEELEQVAEMSSGYGQTGALMVARDADDNGVLEDVHAYQLKLGLDAERLRSHECRRLEPGLAPGIRGGIFVRGDHQVDNRALIVALLEACRKAEVDFVRGKVERVTGTSRVTGVQLQDGTSVECSMVVLAAGAWTNRIGGLAAGVVPPVRPVKGQLVHLKARNHSMPVRRTVRGVEVYIVPRPDGRVVVGATMEEQGFDTTVTAGAVMDLLRDAYELLPGLAEYELTEVACGLRPAAADNGPLLGPTGIDGMSVATAHFRNGILLAPLTADLMSEYLVSGEVPDLMESFLPRRFESAGRAAS